jgi:hypothetical protein
VFPLVDLKFFAVWVISKQSKEKKETYGKILDGQLLLERNTRDQPTDATDTSVFSRRLGRRQEPGKTHPAPTTTTSLVTFAMEKY